MRMNAADTRASSAIAPWTSLTVVSRSSTTLEIDTFISDVSTTSTNIAIASSMARRLLPPEAAAGSVMVSLTAAHELPQLGRDDHGERRADTDQPLVAGHLEGVEDALEEAQLGREDDRGDRQQRRDDERAIAEGVQAEHRAQLVARREREEQVRQREGRQRHRARELLAVRMLGARRHPERG